MKNKAEIHCLNSDCPERFSTCCMAHSKSASDGDRLRGVPAFACSKCGKPWEAPPCNVSERMMEESAWAKRFKKQFMNPDVFDSSSQLHTRYKNGMGDFFGDLKRFIQAEITLAQIQTIKDFNLK